MLHEIQYRAGVWLIVVIMALSACAGMKPLDRITQVAHIEKEVVVRAKVEFEKLRMQGKVGDADYAKGVEAYKQYVVAQNVVAKAIANWQRIGSADSGEQVQVAMKALNDVLPELLKILSQFINIEAVQKGGV